jgi:hypothetical protein
LEQLKINWFYRWRKYIVMALVSIQPNIIFFGKKEQEKVNWAAAFSLTTAGIYYKIRERHSLRANLVSSLEVPN